MSEAYEFLVSRKRLWIIGLSSAAAALLLYGAGFATGLWFYPHTELARRSIPVIPEVNLPTVEAASKKTSGAKASPNTPPADVAPAAVEPQAAAAPAAPKMTPAPTPAPAGETKAEQPASKAAAPAAPPTVEAAAPAPDTSGLKLTVQAGSFSEKGNAERLAKLLRQNGYDVTLLDRTDSESHTWHLVRLGPYASWEAASKVASDLLARHDVNAIIRPVRFN
ncbi:MAG: SPOR domain-containing protein [Bryobacterales bacterium]|nr:SPOR domain-containing protein [Bryobacterales bacterium]